MSTNATSFASPLATVKFGTVSVPQPLEYVVDSIAQASGWQLFFAVLAVAVAYDQCVSNSPLFACRKSVD